ncbi:hypothetical protein ONZ43_g4680 [Nemania bipapillata]|uniref:Uncharacterized protein n=1 Tax=Nemania bipapillata TaxID=110536 RepID=A0ACC2IJM0_9PEZI|nr:hypothetical protein ONZ43_g4680 [Nemania bipapillata]
MENNTSFANRDKIRGACVTARNQGIKWMWIDSCCINKASATEESEAINSMFKWYREAQLCITYLSDVKKNDDYPGIDVFRRTYNDEPSEWFSRGWTLQELLAPLNMQFYDMNWTYMGTKRELAGSIAHITGIETRYLTGAEHFREASIAAKMSWMAQRTTTKEEDIAYSMVGIFGITMTPQYGEGQGAFIRLQETLLSSHVFDESLFAWRMPHPNAGMTFGARKDQWAAGEWGLLAASPDWFGGSGDIVTIADQSVARSFVMTPQGLRAPIQRPLYTGRIQSLDNFYGILWVTFVGTIPAMFGFQHIKKLLNEKAREDFAFTLNCYRRNASGRLENVEIYLRPTNVETVRYRKKIVLPSFVAKRIRCNKLGLSLDSVVNGGERIVLQPRPGFPGSD